MSKDSTTKCPKCDHDADVSFKECPNCGAIVKKVFERKARVSMEKLMHQEKSRILKKFLIVFLLNLFPFALLILLSYDYKTGEFAYRKDLGDILMPLILLAYGISFSLFIGVKNEIKGIIKQSFIIFIPISVLFFLLSLLLAKKQLFLLLLLFKALAIVSTESVLVIASSLLILCGINKVFTSVSRFFKDGNQAMDDTLEDSNRSKNRTEIEQAHSISSDTNMKTSKGLSLIYFDFVSSMKELYQVVMKIKANFQTANREWETDFLKKQLREVSTGLSKKARTNLVMIMIFAIFAIALINGGISAINSSVSVSGSVSASSKSDLPCRNESSNYIGKHLRFVKGSGTSLYDVKQARKKWYKCLKSKGFSSSQAASWIQDTQDMLTK